MQFKIGKHFSTQNLPPKLSSTEIAFHLIEANELIKFDYTKPIVLGRGSKSRTQANHFINLSNYNAYALGMSRDHVQIKLVERHYYISDLATSNGTLVNGKSVLPTKAYLLANSDIIILSRLALVFYQG